ncbi:MULTISPECIES: tyrosine-type recombinase/integrase [unclassified Streptomyces]|uniref:tyrosine-type recombinase/integrase n=1 Tax=unclassified Streptomyces TaxID=2593676 RepID=UPI002E81FC11|nr:tyrosine-type recombinase/integrase [Streptomyces sp. NBC_00589]WTI42242.1 site-specific integrase [Streptomyces sp. NBC_00775]WUB24076.1 site-specific integrase [Streptomyces sp. NBC_00589]
MSTLERFQPTAGLLERLMEVVRPEFRGEEFYPPRDSRVFFQGECRIPSCERMLSYSVKQLCTAHYQRWVQASRPEFEAWVPGGDAYHRHHRVIRGCAVTDCRRSMNGCSPRICTRHTELWQAAGSPDLDAWLATARYEPPPHGEQDCVLPDCPWWTTGPGSVLCRRHYIRWRNNGHPELPDEQLIEWFARLELRRDPYIRFHDLGRQVRLEMQFGLQRRADIGDRHTAPRTVTRALSWIRESGVHSLMDWDETQWLEFCHVARKGYQSLSYAFIRGTRFELQRLLIADDPWADQFPRDSWDLRLLDLANEDCCRLHFGGIPQTWLQDLTKRWARWRLTRGSNPAGLTTSVQAITRLACHLADVDGVNGGPAALNRARIETWFAALQAEGHSEHFRSRAISCVGVFLRDVHRYEWQPDLARNALIYDDAPKPRGLKPRFIPEHLMRQLEAPEAVAQFPSDDGRVLLKILMACGLRTKDARWLPFDCIVRDAENNPYLAWLNRKIHDRPAFFPLSEELAAEIGRQQQAVLERFPQGCKWLFPASLKNVDGSKQVSDRRMRDHLAIWLERLSLTDEHGRPVKVTFHQFRHTLATRMINADVPQPVIQTLLDHMSPAMTAVYAKLHDKTLRRHWENALKVNHEGQKAEIAADHPLAGAAWAKMSLVRAKVTLPNGYCGAPVQTDCEYANPCLDCRFFITTGDFLQQHRQQRQETSELIAQAEQAGLARVAEKNRRTLGKLEAIIDALEGAAENQIVVGGQVEDVDAAS